MLIWFREYCTYTRSFPGSRRLPQRRRVLAEKRVFRRGRGPGGLLFRPANSLGDPLFGVFEGRAPCEAEDCSALKIGLALYRDDVTWVPTTYRLVRVYVGQSDEQHVSEGGWKVEGDVEGYPDSIGLRARCERARRAQVVLGDKRRPHSHPRQKGEAARRRRRVRIPAQQDAVKFSGNAVTRHE